MKKEKGMTLLEAIIATTLFFMFIAAITSCLVVGMNSYHNLAGYKNVSPLFRSACTGLDWISRDLRSCKQIYWPDPNDAEGPLYKEGGYYPGKEGNNPFVFTYYSETAKKNKIVAYTVNYEIYTLERIPCEPDLAAFNPANPATWGQQEKRILSRSVQNLNFKFEEGDPTSPNKLLEINLTSYPDKTYFPIKTNIIIR